ncbi:MAG: thioredoxin family protein [Candidatus Pacebacteria bacterium]|jgi:glutaredoxin|nr:thioredoxin family protein [Candidatus Paceibacterota bacterium]
MQINTRKYVLVFILTCFIFFTAFSISNFLNNKKLNQLKSIEDKISIDILSLETQFSLFEEIKCSQIGSNALSSELNVLSDKLTYAEEQKGITDEDVITLKKFYSLLQIKDYILMKKIAEKCGDRPRSILYFYSSLSCDDCRKQGYVLTSLREKNPGVRVYSFDYDLDVNALKTLIAIHKIKELPAVVINDITHSGYQDFDSLKKLIPSLVASSTPTTK